MQFFAAKKRMIYVKKIKNAQKDKKIIIIHL